MSVEQKPQYRMIIAYHKEKLADGTEKVYRVNQKYRLKGYLLADGTRRQKIIFTDEQKAEMIRLYLLGVKIPRLQQDYGVSYTAMSKIIRDYKNSLNTVNTTNTADIPNTEPTSNSI